MKPRVREANETLKIPVYYGNEERWILITIKSPDISFSNLSILKKIKDKNKTLKCLFLPF